MEFNKYRNTDPTPIRPQRPRLPSNPTPATYRLFADEIEAYENKFKVWEQEMDAWRKKDEECKSKFKADVLDEFGLTYHPKAEEIYAYVYDQADGYPEDICAKMEGIVHLFR